MSLTEINFMFFLLKYKNIILNQELKLNAKNDLAGKTPVI